MRIALPTLVSFAALVACSGQEPPDPKTAIDGGPDPTTVSDAGPHDAAAPDAGQPRVDAGGLDAGAPDSGHPDAGTTVAPRAGFAVVSGAASVRSQRFQGRLAIGASTPSTNARSSRFRAQFGPVGR